MRRFIDFRTGATAANPSTRSPDTVGRGQADGFRNPPPPGSGRRFSKITSGPGQRPAFSFTVGDQKRRHVQFVSRANHISLPRKTHTHFIRGREGKIEGISSIHSPREKLSYKKNYFLLQLKKYCTRLFNRFFVQKVFIRYGTFKISQKLSRLGVWVQFLW